MRRRLQLIRLSLGGAILIALAASLQGQPTTWRTQFENHSYNISAGGFGGYTSNSSPHVTIPFSVTQSGDSSEGTLEVKYPDVLPEGSFSTVGNQYYLVLSSPVTVGFHLEFDYIAARVDPPITISTYLNLEISSGSNTDNPPCKLVSEQRNLTSERRLISSRTSSAPSPRWPPRSETRTSEARSSRSPTTSISRRFRTTASAGSWRRSIRSTGLSATAT